MNTLALIRKTMGVKDKQGVPRKWVIYYDSKHNIAEIKSLFDPVNYNGSRPTYSDKELISFLENIKKF